MYGAPAYTMYKIGRDESDDKSDDFIASPSAAGRHMRVPTARDMRYGHAWRKSSRHRMSQETVTGRFLPARPEAVSGAGWSKELRSMT
ncbi:hypothetical protein EVAR_98268_1 [Eumeta japonica]|uniref:Uncharacterized protein n=1 Tax=Eumeta variegata TaxID=151549 RepID=A0A4C1ZYH7_EUMVA|nr:hypothetical protein EVAR_98268_1 [Eumeta japonica]